MTESSDLFAVERRDDTAIVTVQTNLSEFEYEHIEQEAQGVLSLLDNGKIRNVILDFGKTDYYGSTALGFFVKLWKKTRERGGNMAFCNVSAHEKEILEVTKLDTCWSVCGTCEEAWQKVHGGK